MPHPAPVLAALDAIDADHAFGHRCLDGRWYNPPVKGIDCAVRSAGREVRDYLDTQAARVHEAAHDDDTVAYVVQQMTGFDDDDLAALPAENRDGWMVTGRRAIEALAARLDGVDQ